MTDVCPGGLHPLDASPRRSPSRSLCCDACYQRMPRDLPGYPRFRSALRETFALSNPRSHYEIRYAAQDKRAAIFEAIRTWLAANPSEAGDSSTATR